MKYKIPKFTMQQWVYLKPTKEHPFGRVEVGYKRHIVAEGNALEEAIANNKLVSAAPALFHACELALATLEDHNNPASDYTTIRYLERAIKKARSGQ